MRGHVQLNAMSNYRALEKHAIIPSSLWTDLNNTVDVSVIESMLYKSVPVSAV